MTETSETESVPSPRRHRLRLRYVLLSLTLTAIAVALFYPPAFQALLKRCVEFELRRQGIDARIAHVEGNLFAPLVFSGVQLETSASLVRKATFTVYRITATFDPFRLIPGNDERWLKNLALEGIVANLDIAGRSSLESTPSRHSFLDRFSPLAALPSLIPDRVKVVDSEITLRQLGGTTRLQKIDFSFAENQPGILKIGSVQIDQPALEKRYTDLSASIGIKESDLVIGNLSIGGPIRVRSISINLDELADKRLALDYDIAAFGGEIRGDVMSRRDTREVSFEGTGSFRGIDVPEVGAFVETASPTGGTLEEGKFTFRGSLNRPQDAEASLRIRATDFQWGERRWHLLVAGASLGNREVTLHELSLEQSGNELALSGVFDLPSRGIEWWRKRFELHVSAQINDLAQFSALLGPEAGKASGRIDIDGSVRGNDAFFNGQVIATGSGITYRDVLIDSLNAAARIRGNELQIRHFELLRGDDFVRGECVVNILGAKQYWAELKASIADLSVYSPLVHPPIAPTAFAGGLNLEWSGDGTANAHSGAFHATFNQLLPLEVQTNSAPLDGTMVATYSPGHVFFSTFELGTGKTHLTSTVVIAPDSIKLDKIRIQHDGKTRLSGSALLPVSAWAGWAGAAFNEVVRSAAPIDAKLEATDLPLANTLQLTGKSIPVKGMINGNLILTGSLDNPHATGSFALRNGTIFAEGRKLVDTLNASAVIKDDTVTLTEASGRALDGNLSGAGTILTSAPNDPVLDLSLKAEGLQFDLEGGYTAHVNLATQLTGPVSAVTVAGAAEITSLEFAANSDLAETFKPMADGSRTTPVRIGKRPFRNWTLALDFRQGKPVLVNGNTISTKVTLSGPASHPALGGFLEFDWAIVKADGQSYRSEDVTVLFNPDLSESPHIAAIAEVTGGNPVAILGPLFSPKIASTPNTQPIHLSIMEQSPPEPNPLARNVSFTLLSAVPPAKNPGGFGLQSNTSSDWEEQ